MEQVEMFDELTYLAEELNLDFLIIFGSRATSHYRINSDFDIAYFKSNQTKEEQKKIFTVFQELFQDIAFDCVDISQDVEPRLLFDIFYKGKLLYTKDRQIFEKLKDRVFFYYHDSKQLFEPYRKEYLEA